MNPNLVPPLEPTPVPGPLWLFHVLLVFTFFLHALFMNLALGGTLLAAVAQLGGRTPERLTLARRLMGVNGYGISFAITTGIAPLLFVQVLYQQYFYAATILIGEMWLLFVALLMLGYYAVYLYKFRGTPVRGAGGTGWLVVAAGLFLIIAMVHVSVHLIHVQPGKWAAIAAHPWSILADRTYWPRLLHFVLAALGFSALVATWWAVRQAARGKDIELNRSIARFGWKWTLWTTLLQVVDGLVLLAVLPGDVLLGVMRGGIATLLPLGLAFVLGLGMLMMLARSADPTAKPGLVTGVLATMVLTIAVMAITRHQVRMLYLAPATAATTIPTAPQWGNFALFALLLVAGLATVAYMVRLVQRSGATGGEAA